MKTYGYPTAFSCWGQEETEAIDRVLRSGRFTMGPEVAAFEREFADWHGRRHGIMVNSGSSANLIAVAALFNLPEGDAMRLKPGMTAVVPAIAWSTTYAPLVQHGLQLVVADVDETWNMDILSRGFDPRGARLFMTASILGIAADLEAIRSAAGVESAWLIEDNCESLGARMPGGKLTGTFGDMATFSFFFSHQLSAIEGGMILTDDELLASTCRVLRAHGWTRDVKPPEYFEQEYDFVAFGYNVRPLEMHAAIAREQLKKLPGFIATRRSNLSLFRQLTADLPIAMPFEHGEPSPFGIQFEVKDYETRTRLVDALRAADIDCRLPTGGSFGQHRYGARWNHFQTPIADLVHHRGLFLGNGPINLAPEIRRAVDVMRSVL